MPAAVGLDHYQRPHYDVFFFHYHVFVRKQFPPSSAEAQQRREDVVRISLPRRPKPKLGFSQWSSQSSVTWAAPGALLP